jgi:hypothetical protein
MRGIAVAQTKAQAKDQAEETKRESAETIDKATRTVVRTYREALKRLADA